MREKVKQKDKCTEVRLLISVHSWTTTHGLSKCPSPKFWNKVISSRLVTFSRGTTKLLQASVPAARALGRAENNVNPKILRHDNEHPNSMVKNSPAIAGDERDLGLIPGLGRSPGKENGNPLPAFLLGESHGQRSLVGYSPWGRKELNATEQWRPPVSAGWGHSPAHKRNVFYLDGVRPCCLRENN